MERLETPRLRLRPWTLGEADLVHALRLYGDPEVVRFIGGQVLADLEAARAHLAMRIERQRRWGGRYGAWAAERRDTGEVVGAGLMKPLSRTTPETPEIPKRVGEVVGAGLMKPLPGPDGAYGEDIEMGWHLARAAWGQGYATEIGRGLLGEAERRGLARAHAVTEPANQRSRAVARRLGFIPRGRTRRYDGGLELEHFVCALPRLGPWVLETERLRIRGWRIDRADAEAALRLYRDPEVARWVGGVVTDPVGVYLDRMRSRAERLARWRGRYGVWAVEARATGEVVGTAILKPLPDPEGTSTDDFEVGWHLARSAWGRGLATEMGRGLVAHARRLGELRAIHAVIDPPNLRSIAVARRVGLEPRGQTTAYYEGSPLEHFVLGL